MKAYQFPVILWASAVALTGWVSVAGAAPRAMPPNVYACHVTTSAAFPAVVLVQANDPTEAMAIAQRSMAVAFDGTAVTPANVVQCILPATEKFTDTTFQQGFDKMER